MNNEATFWRYDATGNTFAICDNRHNIISDFNSVDIERLCSYFEVDGALFLEVSRDEECLYHMRYLNADGGEVEMCGNGARALVHFAWKILEIAQYEQKFKFSTFSSTYEAMACEGYPVRMTELFDMGIIPVTDLYHARQSSYLNTGVPHCLFEVSDVDTIDLMKEGHRIRFDSRFERGVNVNFYEVRGPSSAKMRTYERGVEAETLSCGTGACALAVTLKEAGHNSPIRIHVPGGELLIELNDELTKIYLNGAVELKEKVKLDIQSFRIRNV